MISDIMIRCRRMNTFFDKIGVIVCIFIYKICIEVVYCYAVSPIYKNALLPWEPDWNSFGWSIVFTFFIAITFPSIRPCFSCFFCALFDCYSIIPSLSLFWMKSESIESAFYIALFDCLIHLVLLNNGKFSSYNINIINKKSVVFILQLIFILYVLSSLYMVINRGIDYRVLSFLDNKEIYDVRSETKFSLLEGYLFNWNEKVFTPFFLSISLYEKRWFRVVITILCQLLLFLSFGYKLAIFSIGFILFFFILSVFQRKKIVLLIFGMLSISSLTMLVLNISETFMQNIGRLITGIYGMRALFLPAFLTFRYFDFFEGRSNLYFSEGIIGTILGIQSPYVKPIALIMSEWVNGRGGSWNTGVVGDAFANLDFGGLVLIPILLGYVLILCDRVTWHIPNCVILSSSCMYPIYMHDNGFFTSLITNGLLLMIILLGLYDYVMTKNKRGLLPKYEVSFKCKKELFI